MALCEPVPAAGKRSIDWWRTLERTTRGGRRDKVDQVAERIDKRNRNSPLIAGSLRKSAVVDQDPEEKATALWKTTSNLRSTKMLETAEDVFIKRVTEWARSRDYETVKYAFRLAAWDCVEMLRLHYDDLVDEKISTYVVLLGLTRSLRPYLQSAWSLLHESAYHVVCAGQGKEIAQRVLGSAE